MDQQVAPIPVFRPPFLTDGGEFRGSLVEAPANIFYQKVAASRATLNRMQFQWRSVSDSLLLSPTVRLRFRLRIQCPGIWSNLMAYASASGILQYSEASDWTGDGQLAAGHNAPTKQTSAPILVFADGDAFTSCCSSMNLVFNGTSVSLNRCNYFWRDYLKCMVAGEDAARIYKTAGGGYDKYDQRPVRVGLAAIDNDHDGASAVAGITQDSGINERSKTLYSLTVGQAKAAEQGQAAAAQATGFIREVQISVPVPIPPFNPWRGYAMPASSPYTKCPLAIPHLSAGGLDFLLEDFASSFIRRLGSSLAGAHLNHGGNTIDTKVTVRLVANSAELELKYYRLSHTRALKESYRFNIWQAQTFLGPKPIADAGGSFVDRDYASESGLPVVGMKPVGKDIKTTNAGNTALSLLSNVKSSQSITFETINLAQVPSYLLISVPKLNSSYSLSGDAVGKAAVYNLSRNLSIRNIRIIVNSARGAIEKSADVDTGFIDAERLWEMTKENCNSKYFVDGGFRAWRDHNCAILLSSPQFAPGLQACDGVAYPVQIQIEMEVENRSVDISCEASFKPGLAAQNGDGVKNCARVCGDVIQGQAQCTAFYQKVVLATTETAATVNSMNYPLASAERLMNAQGRIR